ncbi:MAG: HAMP domain-containing sensor histidine kinase [Bacteroidales bacterium]
MKRIHLLSKTVFIYLLLTLVSFIISAVIIQREANHHMHSILDERFKYREHHILRSLENDSSCLRNTATHQVTELTSLPENPETQFSDTLIEDEETGRPNYFRKKTLYTTRNGAHYKIVMLKEAQELYRFRDDVFHIVLPAFILLMLATFLSTYLLSGYFMAPFRRILKQMRTYKIGEPIALNKIHTSTYEFAQLKSLFESMHQRIEKDYVKLKEYTENMSHELQTPLAVIQSKAESLLAHNSLSEEDMERVKAIYEEVQHISKMGKSLNLLTRIENNAFRELQPIATAPFIRKYLERIQEIAEMKQLQFDLDLNDSHTLTIDPDLLTLLLNNLLKNALRYSPAQSSIRISTTQTTLQIANQGAPLPFPENNVFDRLKKGSKEKSHGLGLAIVNSICQAADLSVTYRYEGEQHIFTIA